MNTIEQNVAKAILQHEDHFTLAGHTYTIAQPTVSTLIEVSAMASQLPSINPEQATITDVLMSAAECVMLGKIVAMLILGAKRVREKATITVQNSHVTTQFSWRKLRRISKVVTTTDNVLEYEQLASDLLDMSVSQLRLFINARLADMQIADFFAITTSLKGTNIAKSTREVETASGDL